MGLRIIVQICCGFSMLKFVLMPVFAQPVFDQSEAQAAEIITEPASSNQFIDQYREQIRANLASDLPILLLNDLPNSKADKAQQLAVQNPEFIRYVWHAQNKQALRNEIMVARPALPSDFAGPASACAAGDCYRVEMYNFFLNLATIAIIDVSNNKVVNVAHNRNAQPELSARLINLATELAASSAGVERAIKQQANVIGPVMTETKTAFNKSRCERSKHLCVAPTYIVGDRALWAITDLTDMRVVGLKWTALGTSGPPVEITERRIQDESVFLNYCEKVNQLNKLGWYLDYSITSSDGLRIANVTFNNQHVLNDAKVVDWHVSYSLREGFGYSDSTGCPIFSSGVVVAYNPPKIEAIMQNGQEVGFSLIQDFRQLPWPAPCNYRYQQHYQFYKDGRFRIVVGDLGRGCGTDGTYRPVVRIDLGNAASGQAYKVQHWQQSAWQTWEQESWSLQSDETQYQTEKYTHRIIDDKQQGYLIEPGNGQFEDGGRGDNAFTYFTVSHTDKDEGHTDLVTLGACCNTDYRQGPDTFMEPAESLIDQNIIMWYVPQLKNDGHPGKQYCWADTVVRDGVPDYKVWPCFAGPMFTPVSQLVTH